MTRHDALSWAINEYGDKGAAEFIHQPRPNQSLCAVGIHDEKLKFLPTGFGPTWAKAVEHAKATKIAGGIPV